MSILDYLNQAIEQGASDLHITAGKPPILRVDGELVPIGEEILTPADTLELVKETMSPERFGILENVGELDFSYGINRIGRFRVNAYRQRGSFSMAFRTVHSDIPPLEALGLPPVVEKLTHLQRGLILVTGPTGSGKSTTLASMINLINAERSCHIMTLEDPIEYLHRHNKSIVNQREVGSDTGSFASGLRAALREDPDVILVGEMRDLDTISIALTAAETGHLVLSTLHTMGAANTIDRIIDIFPPNHQPRVRVQLAEILNGIIYQQLIPKRNQKGRVGAFEIMMSTNAIRNMIREGKTHLIQSNLQTGAKFGMQTMDNALLERYRCGLISRDSVIAYCFDYNYIKEFI